MNVHNEQQALARSASWQLVYASRRMLAALRTDDQQTIADRELVLAWAILEPLVVSDEAKSVIDAIVALSLSARPPAEDLNAELPPGVKRLPDEIAKTYRRGSLERDREVLERAVALLEESLSA